MVDDVRDLKLDDLNLTNFFIYSAGGVLGVRALLHPLSTMKTRLQVSENKYSGLFDVFRRTLAHEGIPGLYRGFGVAMIGVLPAQTLYITSLEGSRLAYTKGFSLWNQFIENRASMPPGDQYWGDSYLQALHMSPSAIAAGSGFLSGATASCTSAIAGVPADIIAQRQMIRTDKSQLIGSQFRETAGMIREIYNTNGIRGFYRGYLATIFTYAPSSAIWWAAYSTARRALAPWAADNKYKQMMMPAMSGVCAAVTAATLTNPLDVAKTRIQVSRNKLLAQAAAEDAIALTTAPSQTLRSVMKEIYQREGLLRLWTKGLSARATSMSLFAILMSSAYEGIKYLSRKE